MDSLHDHDLKINVTKLGQTGTQIGSECDHQLVFLKKTQCHDDSHGQQQKRYVMLVNKIWGTSNPATQTCEEFCLDCFPFDCSFDLQKRKTPSDCSRYIWGPKNCEPVLALLATPFSQIQLGDPPRSCVPGQRLLAELYLTNTEGFELVPNFCNAGVVLACRMREF